MGLRKPQLNRVGLCAWPEDAGKPITDATLAGAGTLADPMRVATPFTDAPADGKAYGRKNNAWFEIIQAVPLLLHPSMTSNTAPIPFVASASSNWAGMDAYKAFSALLAEWWASGANNTEEWLKMQLDTRRRLSQVIIDSADSTNVAATSTQTARDIIVETSLDDITYTPGITKLDIPKITVQRQNLLNETIAPVFAKFIRMRFPRNWGYSGGQVCVGKVFLFGN